MKYFYLKSINNNAISAMDEHHHEVIILGKAIGIIKRYIQILMNMKQPFLLFTISMRYLI